MARHYVSWLTSKFPDGKVRKARKAHRCALNCGQTILPADYYFDAGPEFPDRPPKDQLIIRYCQTCAHLEASNFDLFAANG